MVVSAREGLHRSEFMDLRNMGQTEGARARDEHGLEGDWTHKQLNELMKILTMHIFEVDEMSIRLYFERTTNL